MLNVCFSRNQLWQQTGQTVLEQQTLEFSKSLLGFRALLPEVLKDSLLRKGDLSSGLLLCHSLGTCGTGSKSSPGMAFARFVVWQSLCCLWFPLSFCRFGSWAGLVSNVTQGNSKVAVAGAQQQCEDMLRKHIKKCFPPHQDELGNLAWESEFPSESLAGWYYFRWLLFDLGRQLLWKISC